MRGRSDLWDQGSARQAGPILADNDILYVLLIREYGIVGEVK